MSVVLDKLNFLTRGDFLLGIIPPMGAILTEAINLLSLKYLKADAGRTLQDESWGKSKLSEDDIEVVNDLIAYTSSGASEIAGLAPTFVSVVTSGFAILKEIQNWFWPTVVYINVIMILTLMVVKLLRGSTCYEIAGRKIQFFPRGKIFKRGVMRTRKQVASYIIYFVNILFVGLAILVYASVTHSK